MLESTRDKSAFWKKEKAIHLGIRLIASEQVKDEFLKEMYGELTKGMMSLKVMGAPLQVVSFSSIITDTWEN